MTTPAPPLTSPDDVMALTGVSVDAIDIAAAQSVVAAHLDLDLDNADLRPKIHPADLTRITKAVIWQTAFMDSQPDLLTRRSDVASASANGVSQSYRASSGSDTSALIAPLAERFLSALSWAGRDAISVITLESPFSDIAQPPEFWTRL